MYIYIHTHKLMYSQAYVHHYCQPNSVSLSFCCCFVSLLFTLCLCFFLSPLCAAVYCRQSNWQARKCSLYLFLSHTLHCIYFSDYVKILEKWLVCGELKSLLLLMRITRQNSYKLASSSRHFFFCFFISDKNGLVHFQIKIVRSSSSRRRKIDFDFLLLICPMIL